MTAPRHLRKLHTAILLATRDKDWRRAERLFLSAPAQYRAVTALLVFCVRLGRASGHDASRRAQKRAESAPSEQALAAVDGMRGEVFGEWPAQP